MLSRRKFLTITVIMMVLFFMFQFSNVIKDRWNEYGTNEYENTKQNATAKEVFVPSEDESDYVVYIGDTKTTDTGRVAAEWAGYTKRRIVSYGSLGEYQLYTAHLPQVVLLDSAYLDFSTEKDTLRLKELTAQGIHLIFCNLPKVSDIRAQEELEKLLGITRIEADSVELTGVHLFEGFLLGGAIQYQATTEKEEKKQDLDLNIPWYVTRSGTKSYMIGMLEDEKIKNENLPGIIWRSSVGDAKIFVVNGNYMEDSTGIGILTAFMSELHEYELYPVVNAQNMVVANYPVLTSENNETMMEYYSRTGKEVFRDIVWPGVAAVASRSNLKLSCMLAPKLDYDSKEQPDEEELIYYLKLMKEQNSEAGLSAIQVSELSPRAKITEDMDFLEQSLRNYRFQSLYAEDETEYLKLVESGLLKDVCTIVKGYEKEAPVLAYGNENVTVQNGTIDGFSHTYSEDIRVKSLETALGYSNIVADMKNIVYPQSKKDTWEKMYDELSSNTDTYWKAFLTFEQTVLSESDKRIRRFLALDFSDERKENAISLEIENFDEQAWFILRTHGEEIQKIEGASYQEIEQGAYLIEAKKSQVQIHMKNDIKLYYYE